MKRSPTVHGKTLSLSRWTLENGLTSIKILWGQNVPLENEIADYGRKDIMELDLLENKEMRDKIVSRVQVLDKVKALLLIPEMNVMTMSMIADYYEVDIESIKKCYQRNKDEIDSDGVCMKTIKEFLKLQNVTLEKRSYDADLILPDGSKVTFTNRGVKCFSKRAVLRFGMLLRDSVVAQEVRTQLLNVCENADDGQKTQDINEEQSLLMDIGRAFGTQDCNEVLAATHKYCGYLKRHITRLACETANLTNMNEELKVSNAALAKETLTWDNKAILNALIRKFAANVLNNNFSMAYGILYKQVEYKHHINIKGRTSPTGKHIDAIKEKEFPLVISVAAAMCEDAGVETGDILQQQVSLI